MTYTPTTEQVRLEYIADSIDRLGSGEEFDRWYAEEIRIAKAEAFDQAIYIARSGGRITNPYVEGARK